MRRVDRPDSGCRAHRLASWIGAHRFLVLIAALLLFAVSTLGITRLSADFSHHGLFFDTDPLLIEYQDFERRFGNDDAIVVAVSDQDSILDPESVALITEISAELEAVPGVIRVSSAIAILKTRIANYLPDSAELDDLRDYAAEIESSPLTGFMISSDQRTSLILAHMCRDAQAPLTAPEVMHAVRTILERHRGTHHQFHVTGAPAITAAFEQAASQDLEQLVPIALGATILVTLFLLRSVLCVVLALLVVALSIGSTLGLAGWVGVDMNNMTMAVPQILIAIGLATSIHILVSFQQLLRAGNARREAIIQALAKNLKPTILTSLTTAIGFFSLATSDLKPILGLGILAGCGTLYVWIFSYACMGPLLFCTGFKVSKPTSPAPSTATRSERFLGLLTRRSPLVLAGYAAICIGSLIAVTRVEVNSDPLKYFAAEMPVRLANEFVEREIGGARAIEVVVEGGQVGNAIGPGFVTGLDELRRWLESSKGVTHVQGPNDVDDADHSAPRWVTAPEDAIRLSVYSTLSTSRAVTDFVNDIRAELARLHLQGSVTGKIVLYQSINDYVVGSFVTSMALAFLLIATILMLVLRSVRLGVLALLANLVPLLSGAAFLWILGKPLDMGTVIAASVCLGIAVDDTIHILTGFSMARRSGKHPRDAIIEVLRERSPALIMTTAILVITFGTFVYGNFMPNVYFGILSAFILTLALATDLTFLPLVLSRSKLSRQEQSSIDDAESRPSTGAVA